MSSADEAYGDDVYQPQESDESAEAQPDLENTLDEPGLDDTLDTAYVPLDRPLAVDDRGTTAAEARTGETLEQRLAREQPEVSDQDEAADESGDPMLVGPDRAGRLAAVDDSAPQRHISVLARDVGIDGGAASAEEAAVHVVEELPPAEDMDV
ncbi:DUF5709 domain-containing protein [Streptomyces erythrochromogenes]|uniref:DUF5709 domain-containing protein n=1 Tax=Streptomyces erythrochromogenes TaxID=285574 RepID=A0ABZ1Q632_9ACTN|nr:DUF5709 domain-containing protein [Streptomyces erythrochromogenes]MCX5583426.1 DUF5709 domain-containing protein [Streptomyces erythrochromogenes]